MTHARAVFESFDSTGEVSQEGILDVGDPNSWLPFIGISPLPAYGWTRAMGLARKGDELGGPKAPDNNADTLALIGAGKS